MCFFPRLIPAKNTNEEIDGGGTSNDMTKPAIEQEEQTPLATIREEQTPFVIVQEEQTPKEEDINNEYLTEIKVECGGDDDMEQNLEAYSVEITAKTEDSIEDDAN